MKQVLLLLLAGLAGSVFPALGQSGSVPVQIEFGDAPPTSACGFSGAHTLFINIVPPESGTLTVNVEPIAGRVTTTPSSHRPVPTFTSPTVVFGAQNVLEYTAYLSTARIVHTNDIFTWLRDFTPSGARSDDGGSTWKAPTRRGQAFDTDRLPTDDRDRHFVRHYRIGARITGITSSTKQGTYTGDISLGFTCSDT